MRTNIVIINLALILIAIACSKSKLLTNDVASFDIKKHNLIVHCNGVEKLSLNNNYESNLILNRQIKCLREKVNNRDTQAIADVIHIFDNIKNINPFLRDKVDLKNNIYRADEKTYITSIILGGKWRGGEIFNSLLKNGNVFGCYRVGDPLCCDPHPNCYSIVSCQKLFFEPYTSMIRSIDGISVEKYLEKNVPYTYERALKDENDKCSESLYKDYYNAIKEAYEKGHVVLKDYGED